MIKIRRTYYIRRRCTYRVTIVYDDNKMGISICSPKDQFSKKVGREIAMERLERNPFIFPFNLNDVDWELTKTMAKSIISQKYLK